MEGEKGYCEGVYLRERFGGVCVEIRLCVICKHRGRDLGACLCVDRLSCVWVCVGRDQSVFGRIEVYVCER